MKRILKLILGFGIIQQIVSLLLTLLFIMASQDSFLICYIVGNLTTVGLGILIILLYYAFGLIEDNC